MKLYFSPSACSSSPHIALREAGLDFQLVKVDLGTHTLVDDGSDFTKINPKGYVPALELDDGTLLTEGPAIVQYIADLKPESGLAPKNGTLARYQLQEWLTFIGTELHKGFSPLFGGGANDEYKAAVKERLLGRLAWVDAQLAGRDYLMGHQFTVADAYLFTVSGWPRVVGMDLSHLKNLSAYRKRVGERPAVVATMKAEGLIP